MQTVTQAAHRARVNPYQAFLVAFQDSGNITAACMVAGITRRSVYRRKESDPKFLAAWEAALEISVDKLEHVARGRAIKGAAKDIYYKGVKVGQIHEPSDRLMELLLKAHRPDKFNPVQKLEHSGGVSVSVMQFSEQGTAQPVTMQGESQRLPNDSADPNASLQDLGGGVSSQGGTPKHVAAQNDEACQVASFSDLEPE